MLLTCETKIGASLGYRARDFTMFLFVLLELWICNNFTF